MDGYAVLRGLRILIVEDEPLIALDLETAVVDHLGVVVGPANTIAGALQLIADGDVHGAIIDLRLKDALAMPVAERLIADRTPFVIHSGQADSSIADAWPTVPIVGKPAAPEAVIAALVGAIRNRK